MHPSTDSIPARLACALASAAVLAGCGKTQPAKAPAAHPQVTVLTLEHVDVARFVDLTGRTSPFKVAEVRARVDGIVQKRVFTEGADVRAGETLYRINSAQYQAQYDTGAAAQVKAEANLAATRAQALRYHDLLASNAVSRQAYDNAAAAAQQAATDVGSAKAEVMLARLNVGYTSVAAPIADRRPHQHIAGHARRLRSGQRRDPGHNHPAARPDLRRPDRSQRRRHAYARRRPGRP